MQPIGITVTSTAPPAIRWRCPSCDHTEFECSQRFRMNSNGKLADIWLIYRCGQCGATKNVTVVERTPVARIPSALFAAATDNDPVVARAMARDVSLIKAAGALVARGDVFEIEPASSTPLGSQFELVFDEALLVRLDEVVSRAARISRSRCRDLVDRGQLHVCPTNQRIDQLRLWSAARVTFDREIA